MASSKKRNPVRTIRLMLIPEPAEGTRSVLIHVGPGTIIIDDPSMTFSRTILACGNCGASLTRGVPVHKIRNIVLQCAACQAWNETLDSS